MSELLSITFAILSSLFASFGQLGLKIGSMQLKRSIGGTVKNYALLAGLFFYGMSTITFVIALRGHELSVLYPIASLNYVWVNLLSIKILKEKISIHKWMGIALIILGVGVITII